MQIECQITKEFEEESGHTTLDFEANGQWRSSFYVA